MIKLEKIEKIYQGTHISTSALKDVSLEIKQGEFVAIMGPSGSGKTTLLNIIGLLDSPTNGCYLYNDIEISNAHYKRQKEIRAHNMGYIFQNFQLIDELTVKENVELALTYNKNDKNKKHAVNSVLTELSIEHKSDCFPYELSSGQQQRVAIARALVCDPKVILADEPTGNLNSQQGEEVMEMLQVINRSGTTVVMVTHSQNHADRAQRTLHLLDGKIVVENIIARQ